MYKKFSYFFQNSCISGVDSEGNKSEADEARVEIKQEADKKKISNAAEVWKIRLTEYGPRMTLKLSKIQEGVNDGEVLYHAYENERDESEILKMTQDKRSREAEKKKRKANQMENIEKKRAKKEAQRQKAIEVQLKREEENKKNKKQQGGGDDDEKPAKKGGKKFSVKINKK